MKTNFKTIQMKKILLLLLLFTGIVNAQIVNIPDANFKAKLVDLGFDTNLDGNIQNIEAEAVLSLNLNNLSLDLNGIEAFTNLTELNIGSNVIIQNANISNLINLKKLTLFFCNQNTLDVSNLINLEELDITYNSISVLNLINLVNLKSLRCANNQISNLNLPSSNILEELDISGNQFSSINLNQFPLLKKLNISNNNNLTSVPISNLLNLEVLNTTNLQNNIVSLSNLPNLKDFTCQSNDFTTLDLSPFPSLKVVNCSANDMTSLNLSGLANLEVLRCNFNKLSSLDLSSLTSLVMLYCEDNLLTTLNITPIQNASLISCFGNLMTTINLSGNNNILNLSCGGINFNYLDVTNLTNLNNLEIKKSSQTSLNLSNNTIFNLYLNETSIINVDVPLMQLNNQNYISLINNPNLVSLNIKNGVYENLVVINNPNLLYICEDDQYLNNITDSILPSNGNNPNLNVGSYCSFTPGGNFNTITGNIKFDANNNGCDISDIPLPNIRVNINDGTTTGASFSSNLGNYGFFTQAGNFDITPEIENSTWFTISPITATIPFADNNNNLANQNFCITANGVHNDLEVIISPITPSRPGFDADYNIVYKNKGNQTLSGDVSLNYDDDVLDFISSTITPTSTSLGNLSWTYNNLLPFESKSIDVKFNVNSPTETPAINIGDILNFNVNITPLTGDELPNDNSFNFNQIVVGSFDPNDITCLEGNSVAPSIIGEYLHYAINFENTGNFPAENIVVKATIDPSKFNINSLQLLNTSNPVDARINGNVVEFIFKNIQLGSGGHGHILLKMKTNNILNSGDNVSKRADIFFDYNFPIDTGFAVTVFQNLSNTVFVIDNSVSISPNPTSSKVNINSNNNIKSIEVYDVQGRILQTILNANNLDLSDKTNGIYFLKITTEKGSKIEKVVKE
jgi:Leucine-rich repeat (LRR) protein